MAYFDCVIWKETQTGKKFAVKIGSAKQRDDGGFAVYLDANPLDGKFTISPQRERTQATPSRPASAAFDRNSMDEEIPF
jgi:hypothetical protein